MHLYVLCTFGFSFSNYVGTLKNLRVIFTVEKKKYLLGMALFSSGYIEAPGFV